MTVRVAWDAASLAVCDAVIAMRLEPAARRVEMARRLGVSAISDEQVRKGYKRNGRDLSFMAHAATHLVANATQTTHDAEQKNSADAEPPTQRSVRVPVEPQVSIAPSGAGGGEEYLPGPALAEGHAERDVARAVAVEPPCRAFVDRAAEPVVRPPTATGLRAAIVLSDLHIPKMSAVAWDLARQVVAEVRPDTLIINGDFLDAAALSSYAKDPGKTDKFADEVEAGNRYLDEIDTWGVPNRIHIGGNHLAGRAKRYIWERAPALHGLISIESLLRFEERGWRFIDYKDHLYFGSTLISHEIGRGGASAMARTRDDVHTDVVIGHVHRAGVHWRGDVMGRTFFGASFGWMGDLSAVDYAHRASVAVSHVLGFGILRIDEETGQTFVEAVPIVNGRCVVAGKLFVSRVALPKREEMRA